MNSDRAVIAIAAGVLVAATAAAGYFASGIQQERRELELVVSQAGTEGMPPHVAIATAALGTFRGLAVDILWARADHLQTEGEFFEAQTLSQWITALQPRFQKVWGFQAWNLAYNIAAATQVPEERWGWVRRGIELLRDQCWRALQHLWIEIKQAYIQAGACEHDRPPGADQSGTDHSDWPAASNFACFHVVS